MRNHDRRIAFLELGVGWRNQLVKQPMYRLALQEPESTYIVFNMIEAVLPQGCPGKGIILEGDIADTVAELEERL